MLTVGKIDAKFNKRKSQSIIIIKPFFVLIYREIRIPPCLKVCFLSIINFI